MAGDRITEIFDFEGALDAGGEEATEGCDERGERGEDEDVELHWLHVDRGREVCPVRGDERQSIALFEKDGIWRAFQACEEICAEVIDRADEVLVPHHEVCQTESEDDGEEPCSYEAFNSLFRGDFDELCAAKGDAADICEDVVRDDKRDREEEPDHALEHVIDDEVGLYDDEKEGEMCPGELGELETVMTLLEGADEEDEA